MYSINVVGKATGATIVQAVGRLDLVAYAARYLKSGLDAGAEYTVTLGETDEAGNHKRTVLELTSSGDVLNLVVGKKIRAERADLAAETAAE
jgi:hypothetical protein